VEHLASARAIPNLTVIRPADAGETIEAWLTAVERNDGPTLLCLTRQNVPEVSAGKREELKKGAYIIRDTEGDPDIIILATGSEVHISIEAAEILKSEGIRARVISFPSWELFERQPEEYRKKILSHGTPKAVVEAGRRMGWERYAGNHALFITMEHFGTSAPAEVLAREYGFTSGNIVSKIKSHLKKA
jgi:transketolase